MLYHDGLVYVGLSSVEEMLDSKSFTHDLWTHHQQKGPDYDFSGGAQLFTANIDGETRKLVGAGQKSGVYTVWDAKTGEKVWEAVISYGGVKSGMHSEASIDNNTVFAWSNNNYAHKPPRSTPLTVKALDAVTGDLKWVANESQPASLVTGFLANDVYIVGSVEGTLKGYHAENGKEIWSAKNPAPITSWLMVKDDMLFLGGAFDKKGAYRLTSVAEVKKSLFRGQDVELWGNKGNY